MHTLIWHMQIHSSWNDSCSGYKFWVWRIFVRFLVLILRKHCHILLVIEFYLLVSCRTHIATHCDTHTYIYIYIYTYIYIYIYIYMPARMPSGSLRQWSKNIGVSNKTMEIAFGGYVYIYIYMKYFDWFALNVLTDKPFFLSIESVKIFDGQSIFLCSTCIS